MSGRLVPHTMEVNVPSDGRPVRLISTQGRVPFVFRPTLSVRIGSIDSVSPETGLLILAGSLFGLGAADFSRLPGDVEGYLYVCTAEVGTEGKVSGVCWMED